MFVTTGTVISVEGINPQQNENKPKRLKMNYHTDTNKDNESRPGRVRNSRIKHENRRYSIKHSNHDRALTKDGVVIAQRANGVLTISPGAEEWISDWDMTYINAFLKTNRCIRRTKEKIIEASNTGKNLLA